MSEKPAEYDAEDDWQTLERFLREQGVPGDEMTASNILAAVLARMIRGQGMVLQGPATTTETGGKGWIEPMLKHTGDGDTTDFPYERCCECGELIKGAQSRGHTEDGMMCGKCYHDYHYSDNASYRHRAPKLGEGLEDEDGGPDRHITLADLERAQSVVEKLKNSPLARMKVWEEITREKAQLMDKLRPQAKTSAANLRTGDRPDGEVDLLL